VPFAIAGGVFACGCPDDLRFGAPAAGVGAPARPAKGSTMTERRGLKKLVRERMARTGERAIPRAAPRVGAIEPGRGVGVAGRFGVLDTTRSALNRIGFGVDCACVAALGVEYTE